MTVVKDKQKFLPKVSSFFDQSNHEPIKTIAYYLYLIGGLGCFAFAIIAFLDQNWLVVATSSSVLLAVIFSLIRYDSKDMGTLFGTVSIGAMGALIIGTTFHFGINDAGIQAVYPILLMIGISFYHRPKQLLVVGVACMLWVVLLYILEIRGFYLDRSEPFTLVSKTIFIIFMIFFMTMMLLVTLQTIHAANHNLNMAKEEAVAARFVAESANQAKSNFLANMSHELRTPLNAIIGYSEIIEEDNLGETQDDAGKIGKSAANLLEIINSILEISKIETGNLNLNIQPAEIGELTKELELITAPMIQAKQNRLKVQSDIGRQRVLADPQKLKQILLNLISNANKFSSGETIALNISADQQSVLFTLSDSGIGISQEDIERIFLPFEQVNNDLNREFEGTGLGLAICKQYALAMDGEIWAESEFGTGSTFSLKLPAVT